MHDTVDERTPAPVDIIYRVFLHARWLAALLPSNSSSLVTIKMDSSSIVAFFSISSLSFRFWNHSNLPRWDDSSISSLSP